MRRLLALMVLSLGLGLLGLYLVARDALVHPAAYAAEGWSWGLGAQAAACLVGVWLLPSVKFRELLAAQGYPLTLYQAFLVHVASVFGVAMTPSGSGGGPAIIMALSRYGVPVGAGLGVAVQIAILDLVTFGILIPVGVMYLLASGNVALPPASQGLAIAGAGLAILGAVLLSRYPRPLVQTLLRLARVRWLRRLARPLRRAARQYYRSARTFRAMRAYRWAELISITSAAWLVNFLFFWLMLQLYGIPAALGEVLAVLSVLTLVSFVIPTPGASGFMELVVGLSVSGRVAPAEIAPPILLWRLGTFYLIFLLGPLAGWLLLLERAPRWVRRIARWRRDDGP